MIWGLSNTLASLKLGGCGSGVPANALRWRGAGEGVPRSGGSSGSTGSPLWGAGKVSERKNGREDGAARSISWVARRPR